MILIKPAGQPVPKVDKRAAESIIYTLDCHELLDEHEVITSVSLIDPPSGATISDIRSRRGTMAQVRISNDPLGTAQYLDCTISLKLGTIEGNCKLAVFQLRVHR